MLLGQLGMSYLCRRIAAHRRSEKVRSREQNGKGFQRQRSQAIRGGGAAHPPKRDDFRDM
jgi:hypothetical protein